MRGVADMFTGRDRRSGLGLGAAWALFGGGFALLTLAAFAVRPPAGVVGRDTAGAPFLSFLTLSELAAEDTLREQFRMLNPAPLFLPFDSALESMGENFVVGLSVPNRPVGAAADFFPPKRLVSDQRPGKAVFPREDQGEPAEWAAHLAERRWFRHLPRQDGRLGEGLATASRVARVEVRTAGDGALAAAFDLTQDPDFPKTDWAPMLLSFFVRDTGEAMAAGMIAASGSEAVDAYVKGQILPELLSKLTLFPGGYLMEVGP